MDFLDLLPDDLIETINTKLINAETNERKKKRKKRKEIQKDKKRIAKQYKICERLLRKAYCKHNNISDFEFCLNFEFLSKFCLYFV